MTRSTAHRAFVFTLSFLLLFSMYAGLAAFFADHASRSTADAVAAEAVERQAQALAALSSSVQLHFGFRDGYSVSRGATTNVSVLSRLPSPLSDPLGELNQTASFYYTNYSAAVGENAGYVGLNVSSVSPPRVTVYLENRSDVLAFEWDSLSRTLLSTNGGFSEVVLAGAFNQSCAAPTPTCAAVSLSGVWANLPTCTAGQVRLRLDLFDANGTQLRVAGSSTPCVSTSGSTARVHFAGGTNVTLNVSTADGLPFVSIRLQGGSLAVPLNTTAVLAGSLGARAFIRAASTVGGVNRAGLFVRAQ